MMGIRRLYKFLKGNMVNSLGIVPHSTTLSPSEKPDIGLLRVGSSGIEAHDQPDRRLEALTAVFGLDKEGRINKERATIVVKKLGLIHENDEELSESGFDISGPIIEEDLHVEEVLEEEDLQGKKKHDEGLLRQAFMVFDEDGDGFIDAKEIKRVLACLGLDNGWGMREIEEMIKVVDLNLDGKVDFHEFELMMA
ncbi:hypothetical protein Ancab_002524 [Ancistrocladus abbreviatus]